MNTQAEPAPGAQPRLQQGRRQGLQLGPRLGLQLALAAVLLVTAWVLWWGWAVLRTDLATAGTRKQVGLWAAGSLQLPSPAAWAAARARLDRAVDRLPSDPGLHESLGALWLVASRMPPDDAARAEPLVQAAQAYEQALRLRPTDSQGWAALALVRQAQGQPMAAVAEAWERARQLGPNDGHVQPLLLEVVLAGWAAAPPAMQAWATALFETGSAQQRRAINRLAAVHGLQFSSDTGNGASAPAATAAASRPAP